MLQYLVSSDMSKFRKDIMHYDVTHRLSDDGQVVLTERWELDGKLCRFNGPALVERSGITGEVISESWYLYDVQHRDGAPAVIEYTDNEQKVFLQMWKQNGNLHRRGGPAVLELDNQGTPIRCEWWINGKKITTPSMNTFSP